MPGPYTNVTGMTGAAALTHLGDYAKTDVIAVTDPTTQVSAEETNKQIGAIVDIVDWIQTNEPLISAAAGYRVSVKSYGALGDGTTDDRAAIVLAIAAAKSLRLPLYFPPGTYRVIQTGTGTLTSPQGFLIDWEGAEIFGEGMHVSTISVEQSATSVYTDGFKFAHGYNAKIRDLGITNTFTEPVDENQITKAGIHCLNNTSTSTTAYTITVERCYITKWNEGIASDGGSYDNYLTMDVIDCDLRNWILGVQCFTFGTSDGTKSVHVRGGYIASYDKASNAASHGMYVAPNVNLSVIGTKFDNWQNTKVAIKQYGQSGTGQSQYTQIIGCRFGVGGEGYSIVCGMFCPTVIDACHFDCRGGIEIRGLCTISNCFFTSRAQIAGSVNYLLPHAASDNDIVTLVATITNCVFDFTYMGTQNWTAIDTGVFENAKLIFKNCTAVVRDTASGSGAFFSCGATGTGAGSQWWIEDCRMFIWNDPNNTTYATFAIPSSGTWKFRNCTMSGDAKTGTGNFRMIACTDLVSLDIDGWDQTGSTLGLFGQMNATSSGKVTARNMRLGTSTTLAQIDCTAGSQRFRFREDYYSTATITASSTALTAWAINTAYRVGQLVQNDTGKKYRCITAGTSAASGGPTGTAADITDNTAHWKYIETASTHALATIWNDYDEYDASGTIDSVLVNGRFNDSSVYEGAKVTFYSSSAGTLAFTALGNVVATAGARAAGAKVVLRRSGGLWVEV